MAAEVSREQVLGYRVRAQQLDQDDVPLGEVTTLDLGVRNTGPDGARWALAVRGVDVTTLGPDDLVLLWTLRSAPHAYRRADLPSIAAATQPFSEADASTRLLGAAKQLKAAGIPVLDALDVVASAMRDIVTEPMVKGDVSSALTERLDPPYLRWCVPCQATHAHEQTFRFGAARAGLELRDGTSPPVLLPIPGFTPAGEPDERHHIIRAYLKLLGPATPNHVAAYLDAPIRDVQARWPDDAVEVHVAGERRWILPSDLAALAADPPRIVRLLGAYDLFMQAQDRPLLVPDNARAKKLWLALGRPGAVLVDSDVVGWWRARKSGSKLNVSAELWRGEPGDVRRDIEREAERLAEFRRVGLAAVHL